MAGPGRAPKVERTRPRDTQKRETLVDEGEIYGSELPDGVLPKGETWHPQTLAWWDAIRCFPLLKDEPPIGWQFLLDTALMHHTMWTKGRWEFASELRLRVAKYGATPEDRLRLKISVVPGGAKPDKPPRRPGSVSDISSRRARLTS